MSNLTNRRVAGVTVAVGAAVLFALIAERVTYGGPLAFDTQVAAWLLTHGEPRFSRFMWQITQLHGSLVVGIYALIVASILAWKRQWHWLGAVGLIVHGGLAMNVVLKQLFQRARPPSHDPQLVWTIYGFPSGHTAAATLFYGLLAALVMSRIRGWLVRIACVLFAAMLVTLVGMSRVYLGVHYPSDVLGAVAWSLAWIALWLTVIDAVRERRAPPASPTR